MQSGNYSERHAGMFMPGNYNFCNFHIKNYSSENADRQLVKALLYFNISNNAN